MEVDDDVNGPMNHSLNQDDSVQELQHSLEAERKHKKKRHGNRKLQRYRRKLRDQATKFDTMIASEAPSIDANFENPRETIEQQIVSVSQPVYRTSAMATDDKAMITGKCRCALLNICIFTHYQ